MNLEKKLKRKKNAEIVETCEDSYTEEMLQELLNKYSTTQVKEIEDNTIKKYYFKNVITNETLTSIYSDLNNIPYINKEEWKKL